MIIIYIESFILLLILLLIIAFFLYFIVRIAFKHSIKVSQEEMQIKIKNSVKLAINEYEWKRNNQ